MANKCFAKCKDGCSLLEEKFYDEKTCGTFLCAFYKPKNQKDEERIGTSFYTVNYRDRIPCFGLIDGMCEVLSEEGAEEYKEVCGTVMCPFYKPEGEEEKTERLNAQFIPLSENMLMRSRRRSEVDWR